RVWSLVPGVHGACTPAAHPWHSRVGALPKRRREGSRTLPSSRETPGIYPCIGIGPSTRCCPSTRRCHSQAASKRALAEMCRVAGKAACFTVSNFISCFPVLLDVLVRLGAGWEPLASDMFADH